MTNEELAELQRRVDAVLADLPDNAFSQKKTLSGLLKGIYYGAKYKAYRVRRALKAAMSAYLSDLGLVRTPSTRTEAIEYLTELSESFIDKMNYLHSCVGTLHKEEIRFIERTDHQITSLCSAMRGAREELGDKGNGIS